MSSFFFHVRLIIVVSFICLLKYFALFRKQTPKGGLIILENIKWKMKHSIIAMALLMPHFALSPCSEAQELDLLSMNLETLMTMQVTSVGKKEQELSSSAAAIHVITAEDIKQSGITTIADLLKMVPGLHVARVNSDKWAINSRDLGSRFAENLLVLIDDRSVYSPSFSGVYWEVQDTILADIARIEVIRGPGATLWGANAVNGVINIITKNSKETKGGLVEVGVGDLEHRFGSARYGAELTNGIHARIYGKGFERTSLTHPDGKESTKGWENFRGGFRLDADITHQDTLTLQGDIYEGDVYQFMENLPNLPMASSPSSQLFFSKENRCEISGGHLQLSWQKILSSSSEWNVQTYYDRLYRKELFITEKRENLDLEFEHRFSPLTDQDVVWGLRCNHTQDHFDDTLIMSATPGSVKDTLFSLFIQDELLLIPETLWLTLGTKLEHNDYIGYELLPSARLFWSINAHHKMWGAISRAVRSPSRLERDGKLIPYISEPFSIELSEYPYTNPLPMLYSLSGDKSFESETLLAWEAGYRFIASPSFSADLAIYYNEYKNSRAFSSEGVTVHDTWIEHKICFANGGPWETYGGELTVAWQAMEWLKLDMGYSLLMRDRDTTSGSKSDAPKHQLSLRGNLSPFEHFNLHWQLKYVNQSSQVLWSAPPDFIYDIDSYTTLDITTIWQALPHLALSLSINNLFDAAHVEALQEVWIPPEEMKRTIYGKATWVF